MRVLALSMCVAAMIIPATATADDAASKQYQSDGESYYHLHESPNGDSYYHLHTPSHDKPAAPPAPKSVLTPAPIYQPAPVYNQASSYRQVTTYPSASRHQAKKKTRSMEVSHQKGVKIYRGMPLQYDFAGMGKVKQDRMRQAHAQKLKDQIRIQKRKLKARKDTIKNLEARIDKLERKGSGPYNNRTYFSNPALAGYGYGGYLGRGSFQGARRSFGGHSGFSGSFRSGGHH